MRPGVREFLDLHLARNRREKRVQSDEHQHSFAYRPSCVSQAAFRARFAASRALSLNSWYAPHASV